MPPDSMPAPDAPKATDRQLLARPVRQSPVALVFIAWRFIRRVGLINLGAALLFTLTGGFSFGLWFVAIVLTTGILVYSLLSWWRNTFVVVRDELVVTRGVMSVERLVIPLDRVQSVSIDQKLLHRIVGLVSASIDTAGSNDTEFEIAAIDVATAEALRRVASGSRVVRPTAAEPGPTVAGTITIPEPDLVLLHRSPRELALAGATTMPWAGLAVLAPLIAFGDEIDVLGRLGGSAERVVERWTGDVSIGRMIVVVTVAITAAGVFGTLLQTTRELVTNWDLTLHRTATGLRRTAGLLNRTSRSSTVRRVQAIVTNDTPLQRRLGITTLTLRTFGDVDIGLPGSRPDDVVRLRETVFGTTAPPPLTHIVSRWSVFMAARTIALVAVPVALILSFRVGWWSTTLLAAVPLRWAVATWEWRRRRWGLDHARIAESHGLLRRHTAEAPLVKAQVVKVTQSFFERRRGLATVRIQTADGFLSVPLVDHDDATAVRDRVLYAVETDRRPVL
ncbi:MAG: PH domain-containing protein [Ilumatobacter sp.]